jgi:hypothetical protein
MAHIGAAVIRLLPRYRVRFVCLAFLFMGLALLAVNFATARQGQTAFGPSLGADYIGFYSAAALLNTAPPQQLYDRQLQDRIYHDILPGDSGHLPYFHPPFVALAFRPLARLPYAWSFAAWLVLGAGFYAAGLVLALGSLAPADRPLAALLALSFEPFLMECWMGGQLSAFGFFCFALAAYCLERGRPLAAGAALGLCLYKPPLLLLFVPLLLVARWWRALAGLVLMGVVLAGLSVTAIGWQACLEYARLLMGFARVTGSTEAAVIPTYKYVDLNSFLRLLSGGPSPVVWVLLPLMLAVPLGYLAAAWWRINRGGAVYRRQVWAATLTWTLLANLYVGVYDSVLVVLAALGTAGVLSRPGKGFEPSRAPGFVLLLLLVYMGPVLSQYLALSVGLQLYSLILLAFACYQLALARALVAPAAGGELPEPGRAARDEACCALDSPSPAAGRQWSRERLE